MKPNIQYTSTIVTTTKERGERAMLDIQSRLNKKRAPIVLFLDDAWNKDKRMVLRTDILEQGSMFT